MLLDHDGGELSTNVRHIIVNPPIAPESGALNTRQRWTVLGICASSLFLVGLDTTIVTVSLSHIGASLHVPDEQLAWVVDAYTITFAALLITSGALADRFGRRRVFLTGLSVFLLASLACSVAPTAAFLIGARAVQGIGASMLTPVALAIVVNVMPDPRERAQAIGIWSAMFGLSMAAGPALGGALLTALDWRAVFWINAPIVVLAMLLVIRLVPESKAARARKVDLGGQVLLVVLLGLVVALLIEGPRLGWLSPVVIGGAMLVPVLLVTFWWVESRRKEALIDPALFRHPAFTGAVLSAIVVFIAFSATLLLTTTLLQNALGWGPLAAGAATLPMAVGTLVFAPLSGHLLSKTGPRIPLLYAGATLLLGGFLLIALTVEPRAEILLAAYLLIGIAVGLSNPPITNTAVNGLPAERAGVAGGLTSTARQIGTALGIALAGALVGAAQRDGGAPDAVALLPGWLLITLCGAALLGLAFLAPGRTTPKRQPLEISSRAGERTA